MIDLRSIVDTHLEERFLVCGTGESVDQFGKGFYEQWEGISIGVNGITDLFTPDYYINIHTRPGVIESNLGSICFSYVNPSSRIDNNKSGLLSIIGTVALTALTLAYQLGAGEIYLIGVDLQGGHFKGCRSDRPDTVNAGGKMTHFIHNKDELKRTQRAFSSAFDIYSACGVELFNLSGCSLLGNKWRRDNEGEINKHKKPA